MSIDRKRFRRGTAGLALSWLIVCAAAPSARGQQPQVETAMGDSEIYFGESVMYQVRVLHAEKFSAPDLSAIEKSFRIEAAGDQSLNSQSITIVNGRMTQQVVRGHDYRFRLTPLQPGRIRVPSAAVVIDGQKYFGTEFELNVVAPRKQDWVRAEIVATPMRAYPTQPFTVTLRVTMRPLPDGDTREPVALLRQQPVLSMPWVTQPPKGVAAKGDLNAQLSGMLSRERRGFALDGINVQSNDPFFGGFSMFSRAQSAVVLPAARREKQVGLDGRTYDFFVYEIALPFTAEKAGDAVFGPALLKGQFITGTSGREYTGEKLVVSAPALTVRVLDPQTQNAPDDFSGAIGSFALTAAATPQKLRVGDPLTLELIVRAGPGSGSMDLVGAPVLNEIEAITRDFTVIDDKPVGETKDGVKRFSYGLRPKKPGVRIPSITMSYFDPVGETFKQARSEPLDLEVSAGASVATADLVTGQRSTTDKDEIKSVVGGLRQNISDLRELGDQRTDIRMVLVLPFGLMILYALLNLCVQRHRQLSSDVGWQRKQRALREARLTLEKAKADLSQAPSLMRACLLGFVADVCNLPAAGLTPRDAEQALERLGAAEASRKDLVSLLESLEAMAYGGASASDIDALCRKGDALLVTLQKEAARKG